MTATAKDTAQAVDAAIVEAATPKSKPALSPHIADLLVRESPLHAFTAHRLLGGLSRPSTPSQSMGTAMHNLFLEDGSRIVELEYDSYRKAAAQEDRDRVLAAGKLPFLSEPLAEARYCVKIWRERLAEHDITVEGKPLSEIFGAGETELRLSWTQEGVLCSGVIDWLSPGHTLFIDLKVTEASGSPHACQERLLYSAGVIQNEAYKDALEIENMDIAGRVSGLFLFAQSVPPFALTPIVCGGSMREIGSLRWNRALRLWPECLKKNHWPSYTRRPIPVEAPPWMVEREILEG